jgi:hypothetical protein
MDGSLWSIDQIDHVFWAHYPSEAEETYFQKLYDVSLHHLVYTFMRHKYTPYCKKATGTCRVHFPQPPTPHTFVDEKGQLHLRRRPEDFGIVIFSPHQLCLTRGHICSFPVPGVSAIPYIATYLGKGDSYARTALINARRGEKKTAEKEKRDPKPLDVKKVRSFLCLSNNC